MTATREHTGPPKSLVSATRAHLLAWNAWIASDSGEGEQFAALTKTVQQLARAFRLRPRSQRKRVRLDLTPLEAKALWAAAHSVRDSVAEYGAAQMGWSTQKLAAYWRAMDKLGEASTPNG